MRLFIISAVLLSICLPLFAADDAADPNYPNMTKQQFDQAVIDALIQRSELFETKAHPATHPICKSKVYPCYKTKNQQCYKSTAQTIAPSQLDDYQQKILDRAETYYDNRFDSLQTSLAVYVTIFLTVGGFIGIVIGVVVPYHLEKSRKELFKEKMEGLEKELKDDTDSKLTATEDILKQDMSNEVLETNKEIFLSIGRLFGSVAYGFHEQCLYYPSTITNLYAISFYVKSDRFTGANGIADGVFDDFKRDDYLCLLTIKGLSRIEGLLVEVEDVIKNAATHESKIPLIEKLAAIKKLLYAQMVKLEHTEDASPD